jgi:hypothetical protein
VTDRSKTDVTTIDPAEWMEVGNLAVRTRSLFEAWEIAAAVSDRPEHGFYEGQNGPVEYMPAKSFCELVVQSTFLSSTRH